MKGQIFDYAMLGLGCVGLAFLIWMVVRMEQDRRIPPLPNRLPRVRHSIYYNPEPEAPPKPSKPITD